MSEPGAAPAPRWLLAVVAAATVVMLVVGWGPRLQWGLWLDETFVAWQAEAGWTIARDKLGDPAQSVLFGYIEALFYFPGSPHMELWLRLPALIGGLASCLLAYRLAERLVGKGTGVLAFVVTVADPQMIVNATQARPYTCGVAACLASLLGLLRWLETGRRRDGLAFSLSLALAVHMHLLFATFAVVPAFVLYRRARRGGAIDWPGLSRWLALTALLTLPLVWLVHRLSGGTDPSAVGLFSLGRALAQLIPWTVMFSLLAFALLLVTARRNAGAALRAAFAGEPPVLATFWLLVPPLLLLSASHLLHRTLFLDRYYAHTVAAEALLVAALLRGFPPAPRALVLIPFVFGMPIAYGAHTWSQTETMISWRPPMQIVRRLDPSGAAPVFVQSGHPPSNTSDWQHGIEKRLFLYSQIAAYPLPNRVYPLPYNLDESVQTFVRRLADTELAGAPVVFVAGLPKNVTMRWIAGFFEARGYTVSYPLEQGFWLIALRKPATSSP
ncbi:MAG TPA: glycosyltransferase family 39 protein [Polyangia bacterium]|jgi:hypothetical protein